MKICSLFAMKFPVVFAIIAGCFSGNLYGESLEPIIFARKADKAMIIDGKDTEPCYASAVPSEEFKKISGEKADPSSRVRVVYDAEKIYFFYDCDEPEIAGKNLSGDAVELFINGNEKDRNSYYQLYVPLKGDLIINRQLTRVKDPSVLRKFEVKIHHREKGFCCEIAVSRDLFPQGTDQLWRVNFNRNRSGNPYPGNLSYWSETGLYFHTPSRFGYLFPGEKEQFMKRYFCRIAKQKIAAIEAFAKDFPDALSEEEQKEIYEKYRIFESSLNKNSEISHGKDFLAELDRYQNAILVRRFGKDLSRFGKPISKQDLEHLFSDVAKELSADQVFRKNIKNNIIYRPERKGNHYFDPYLPADFYTKIAEGKFNRNLYPKFSDRNAWETARKSEYADLIIAQADAIPEKSVPPLLFSMYRRYATDGDRAEYENASFLRRRHLGFLAIALCLTGDKEKYMPRLLDYTTAIMEEFTWCVPAHAFWDRTEMKLQSHEVVDLFASETGAAMALLYHILGDELDKYEKNLSERIRETVLQRTVYNVFHHPESKAQNWWYRVDYSSNWSAWCSGNNLLVTVLLEKDPERAAGYIRELLKANANYAYHLDADGYCDEGPVYYSVAGLNLFTSLALMQKIIPGSMDKLFALPKLRGIFEYILHVGIGKNGVVNYGDNGPRVGRNIKIAMCGKMLNSPQMQNLNSDKKFSLGGNGDELATCLKILFDNPETVPGKNETVPFSYYKDRLAVLRSDVFSVALKAGNNDEQHNHNDLGHLTLYYKDQPVIVDAGNERYSRINFSDQRYTLWYNRGAGHNAPVFDSIEQIHGRKYKAVFEHADGKTLSLDLSRAYPASAGVRKFIRSIDFSGKKVVLADQFDLAAPKTALITFLTPQKVEKISDHILQIGEVRLELSGIELQRTYTQEKRLYWGGSLTAVVLKSTGNHYKITFREK